MKGDVQKSIMRRLLYAQGLRYNELWGKEGPSNLFDYHLKQLMEEGLVEKQGDAYRLTVVGLRFASSLDGVAIEQRQRPIVCSFVLGVDDEGRLLVHRRLKQPFYGYVGLPGGKLELGDRLQEQAAREFLEETGMRAERCTLKLITNYLTYDGDELAHQVVGFFFLAEGLSGELLAKNREGENFFIRREDSSSYKLYPDFSFFVESLLSPQEGLRFHEAKRFIKDGEFLGMELLD